MKISERWLREWVSPEVDTTTLAHRLNMAGLECVATPLLPQLPRGVVVGAIVEIEAHPSADRLRVCTVDTGGERRQRIVCGAPNAAVGLRAPTALPGAVLPDGTRITETALRGVASQGMLCSAAELGLAEHSDGLLALDADAPLGRLIEHHLQLDDHLLDLDLTPNRGDCLSVLGLARETAALYALALSPPEPAPTTVQTAHRPEIEVVDSGGCPHYAGRVIDRVDATARIPDWMRERLRRSGIRSIHPLVDITNFVMLELGQPMHAFDQNRLQSGITVRAARSGEAVELLNDQRLSLSSDDLVIADREGVVALAGVMGGKRTAVGTNTDAVLLESASFDPVRIATAGRRYKLLSDARYRYERGIDPELQRRALERASTLILEICGGEAGPVVEVGRTPDFGARILLRKRRVDQLLGIDLPETTITALLRRLGIAVQPERDGAWIATTPGYRHDLRLEVDLVEEIGRLHGYDAIPPHGDRVALTARPPRECQRQLDRVKDLLVARGYREIITYSFIDAQLQRQLLPDLRELALDNPIAETMNVMRGSLWPGLLSTWQYNRQRQRDRARLFEAGQCFWRNARGEVEETMRLAGLLCGSIVPEQWGVAPRNADYYDLKGDVEALLGRSGPAIRFEPDRHPALHPGRSARIYGAAGDFGWIGALHPKLCRALDLPVAPLMFELDWSALSTGSVPTYQPLSEQPSVRRDLALLVPEACTAQQLIETIRACDTPQLREIRLFDLYRGERLPEHFKSVALGLIFQGYSSTLTDDEVDALARKVTVHLGTRLGVSLRGA